MPIFCPILALICPQGKINYDDPLAMGITGHEHDGPAQILADQILWE
ncbi:hypothetical protein OAH90_05235 [Alphaproteobacteria bacterium]|jgi:hypothetical protein|nr:hypothetical protein [Alphaproteobacteria bacterium]